MGPTCAGRNFDKLFEMRDDVLAQVGHVFGVDVGRNGGDGNAHRRLEVVTDHRVLKLLAEKLVAAGIGLKMKITF